MKKLKQAKAEAKTDLEKLTTEHELKYKDIEVFRFLVILGSSPLDRSVVSQTSKNCHQFIKTIIDCRSQLWNILLDM